MKLTVEKSSGEELAFTNNIYVNPKCSALSSFKYITIEASGRKVFFSKDTHPSVTENSVGLSFYQRRLCASAVGDQVEVSGYNISQNDLVIGTLVCEMDALKKSTSTIEIDSEDLAKIFVNNLKNFPLSFEQTLTFKYSNMGYLMTVKSLQGTDYKSYQGLKGSPSIEFKDIKMGFLLPNALVRFQKAPGCNISLTGKSKQISGNQQSIVNPNWDFTQLGVGGLDAEFNTIFRRAFSSRIFPPEIVDELGIKHVRGILLFGPPGTGKTLLARQIGKMLNTQEPKIINGPEVLNKFVGESEANIRKLFEDAEADQSKLGINSPLHLIIFDEIDAICKQRGQSNRGSGVHDTVVNQLLSKIDGVNQLNNILIIGMTNRRDLIDVALLRPGRFEIQLEIALPNLEGRIQILNIHTSKLKKNKKLSTNVDICAIADEAKNFSGAEIEGLVRAATTTAMNRLIKLEKGKIVTAKKPEEYEKFVVEQDDFVNALKFDIKPSYGSSVDNQANLNRYVSNGIVVWSSEIEKISEKLDLMVQQTLQGSLVSPVSVLIEGCDGAGKTALAVRLGLQSNFPMVRICTPDDMIGMNEFEKCDYINRMFLDIYKSDLSCIIIDDIERMIDYVAIGPRFSNSVLQTLFVLVNKKQINNRKILIACTTSSLKVLNAMEFSKIFTTIVHVPNIKENAQLKQILLHYRLFSESEVDVVLSKLQGMINVPIKKLLSLGEMATQISNRDRAVEKLVELLTEELKFSKSSTIY